MMKGLTPPNQPWNCAYVSRETVRIVSALLSWNPGSKHPSPREAQLLPGRGGGAAY